MFTLSNYILDVSQFQDSIRHDYDKCFQILESSLKHIQFPKMVSIGSGGAYFEYCVSEILDNLVTCVDPNPLTYAIDKKIHIEPDYKTIDDISPETLKTFNYVFILWPYPDSRLYNSYDYVALQKILPDGFFVVYGPCGAAGSYKFIRCLAGIDVNDNKVFEDIENDYDNTIKITSENDPNIFKEYICTGSHKIIKGIGRGFSGATKVIASYIDKKLLTENSNPKHTVNSINNHSRSSLASDMDDLSYNNNTGCYIS